MMMMMMMMMGIESMTAAAAAPPPPALTPGRRRRASALDIGRAAVDADRGKRGRHVSPPGCQRGKPRPPRAAALGRPRRSRGRHVPHPPPPPPMKTRLAYCRVAGWLSKSACKSGPRLSDPESQHARPVQSSLSPGQPQSWWQTCPRRLPRPGLLGRGEERKGKERGDLPSSFQCRRRFSITSTQRRWPCSRRWCHRHRHRFWFLLHGCVQEGLDCDRGCKGAEEEEEEEEAVDRGRACLSCYRATGQGWTGRDGTGLDSTRLDSTGLDSPHLASPALLFPIDAAPGRRPPPRPLTAAASASLLRWRHSPCPGRTAQGYHLHRYPGKAQKKGGVTREEMENAMVEKLGRRCSSSSSSSIECHCSMYNACMPACLPACLPLSLSLAGSWPPWRRPG